MAETGPGAKQNAAMPEDWIVEAVVFMIFRTRSSEIPLPGHAATVIPCACGVGSWQR